MSELKSKMHAVGYDPFGYDNTGKLLTNGKISPEEAYKLTRLSSVVKRNANKHYRRGNAVRNSIGQAIAVMLKKNPASALAGMVPTVAYNEYNKYTDNENNEKILNKSIQEVENDPHSETLGEFDINHRYKNDNHETFKPLYNDKKIYHGIHEGFGQALGGMAGYGAVKALTRMFTNDPTVNDHRMLLGIGSGVGGYVGRTLLSRYNDKKEDQMKNKIISTKSEE